MPMFRAISAFILFGLAPLPLLANTKGGGLPQLNIETFSSQIFWLIVCFLVLYLVVQWRIQPMVESVLEKRAQTIARNYEQAEALSQKAIDLEQNAKSMIASAQDTSKTAFGKLLKQLHDDYDSKLLRVDHEFDLKWQEKYLNIEKLKNSLDDQRKLIIMDISRAITKKLAGIDPTDQELQKGIRS